jgi:hypothetical protein
MLERVVHRSDGVSAVRRELVVSGISHSSAGSAVRLLRVISSSLYFQPSAEAGGVLSNSALSCDLRVSPCQANVPGMSAFDHRRRAPKAKIKLRPQVMRAHGEEHSYL